MILDQVHMLYRHTTFLPRIAVAGNPRRWIDFLRPDRFRRWKGWAIEELQRNPGWFDIAEHHAAFLEYLRLVVVVDLEPRKQDFVFVRGDGRLVKRVSLECFGLFFYLGDSDLTTR